MAHVLLIEPDRILSGVYSQALAQAGHDVRTCTTAQAAIQKADEALPNVVILELQLVAHSGIEFLYEFRSYTDWQHIPVIVHTNVPPAEFNQSTRLLQEQLKVTSYHYKPATTLASLLQAVGSALAYETA
jgi:DNA-binding response OmpR family regulator